MVVAVSGAVGTSAMAATSESVAAGCKELPIAPAKRILGTGVMLSQGGDDAAIDGGKRSICSVSFSYGPTMIFITSESAKSFRYQIDYYRRGVETGRVKRLVPVRLGDEGYSLDKYNAGSFESHMHVFRVGSRMFQVEDYGKRRSITAAKRLALAKAVVTKARS